MLKLKAYQLTPLWRLVKNREIRDFLKGKVKVNEKVKALDDMDAGAEALVAFEDIEGTILPRHPDPGCECPEPATIPSYIPFELDGLDNWF